MYKSKLAVCAESVVLDQQTQLVSIFNLIDAVQAHGFPLAVNKIALLFSIVRETTDLNVLDSFIVATLSGVELLRHPIQINFFDKVRANHIVTLQGVVLSSPGILRFSLLQGEAEIATVEVDVKSISGPTITPVPVATLHA